MNRDITTRLEKLEAHVLGASMLPSAVDAKEEARAMLEYWEDAAPDLPADLVLAWLEEGMTDFDLGMSQQMEAPARHAWLLRQCLTWCYLVHGRWESGTATGLAREIRGHLDQWIPFAREEASAAARQAWIDGGDGTAPPWSRAEWEELWRHFTPCIGPQAGVAPDWFIFRAQGWCCFQTL